MYHTIAPLPVMVLPGYPAVTFAVTLYGSILQTHCHPISPQFPVPTVIDVTVANTPRHNRKSASAPDGNSLSHPYLDPTVSRLRIRNSASMIHLWSANHSIRPLLGGTGAGAGGSPTQIVPAALRRCRLGLPSADRGPLFVQRHAGTAVPKGFLAAPTEVRRCCRQLLPIDIDRCAHSSCWPDRLNLIASSSAAACAISHRYSRASALWKMPEDAQHVPAGSGHLECRFLCSSAHVLCEAWHVRIPGAIWLSTPIAAAPQKAVEEGEQEQECMVCGWFLQQRHFPLQRGTTRRKRTCFGCSHKHRVLRTRIKEGRTREQCAHSNLLQLLQAVPLK